MDNLALWEIGHPDAMLVASVSLGVIGIAAAVRVYIVDRRS